MGALSPADEAALAEVVRAANGPLRIEGGGTRRAADGDGQVLTTSALTGVALYEPGALTLVARAGTPIGGVEKTLAAEGQRLPFEPMDHRPLLGTRGTPTIGGTVAANVSGPRRIQAGSCRDSVIGLRFVDGEGRVVKSGGRVMKNVTGYDLVKLLAGSHGTLGVLTEVAFKVLPAPPAAATLTLRGLDPGAAVAALSQALTTPFEVNAAAHDPGAAGGPATHIRIEGFETSIAYRAERLADLWSAHGTAVVETDAQISAELWRGIRDAQRLADAPGDVWRLSVKPTDGPEVARRLPDADLLFDWGGGLIWVRTTRGTDLRAAVTGMKGHATLVRAAAETHAALGTFPPEPAPLAAITAGLRAKFDPRGIFNPGLMATV